MLCVHRSKLRALLKLLEAGGCNIKTGIQAAVPLRHDSWEYIILMHHLISDTALETLPFNEQKVSAYYSIMVVYLYVGEHHPLVNGRKHF